MAQDQLSLSIRKGRKGRHEIATDKAIAAAQRDKRLTVIDSVVVTTCRALAHQLDVAERKGEPYATAAVARELLAACRAAGLVSDGADTGLTEWLNALDDEDEAEAGG